MSTLTVALEVLPSALEGISYLTDPAIVDETDVSTLHHNAGNVKEITKDVKNLLDPVGLGVFQLSTSLSEEVGEGTLYEYGVGPLTLTKDGRLSLQTFFSPPLLAPQISIDSSYGTLDKGISATLGLSDILDGTVNITEGAADKHVLQYDVTIKTSGDKHYRGEITLEF